MDYYSRHYKEYIDNTKNADMTELYAFFLKSLKKGSKSILDLGFGSGRDSLFFKSNGFEVVSLDPNIKFCDYGKKIGLNVINMKAEDLDYDSVFDGIWACASLLHIPAELLNDVFVRCFRALKDNGSMYASFKYGDFEGIRNERYFTDLNEKKLSMVLQGTGFSIENMIITNDVRPERDDKWLNIILKKHEEN